MQENNPYSAPGSAVADVAAPDELQLADRGMRLVAAIIDGVILVAILLPMMFVGGYFTGIMAGQQPRFRHAGAAGAWSDSVVFLVVQGYPLNATGQTWGKKALKMKIVDLEGRKPDFTKLFVLRYVTTQLIGLIPVLGTIYGFVNVLFIFGEDRRCLHDKIAGTRVVVAN